MHSQRCPQLINDGTLIMVINKFNFCFSHAARLTRKEKARKGQQNVRDSDSRETVTHLNCTCALQLFEFFYDIKQAFAGWLHQVNVHTICFTASCTLWLKVIV